MAISKLQYQKELIEHMRIQKVFSDDILFHFEVLTKSVEAGIRNRREAREQAAIIKQLFDKHRPENE